MKLNSLKQGNFQPRTPNHFSMNFEVRVTPHFEREAKTLAKRHRSFKNDLNKLIDLLSENPIQGADLGSGIRKIRFAITSKGRGKAGGARIITYTVCFSESTGRVYLIDVYDKSDYSTANVAIIKSMIADLGL